MTKTKAVPALQPRDAARVFAALSVAGRVLIVEYISKHGEASCGAIGEHVGMSPSLASHHLDALERAGLINRRREGLHILNSLNRDQLRQLGASVQLLAAGR